jgi:hypothetical protein
MKPENMGKAMRIVEWAWVFIGGVSLLEVVQLWSVDRSKAGLFALFAVGAGVMYFLRRRQRQRFDDRHVNNNQ